MSGVAPQAHYGARFSGIGELSLTPLRLPEDIATIHPWVRAERAAAWGLVGASEDTVLATYREILSVAHFRAYLGRHDGAPAFLVETYEPAKDHVAAYYDAQAGDRGMHVLVAPTDRPVAGFTDAVFATILGSLFRDPGVDRVVVEPDVRNAAIRRRNRRSGFVEVGEIVLPTTPTVPGKTAMLSFCSRQAYVDARRARWSTP